MPRLKQGLKGWSEDRAGEGVPQLGNTMGMRQGQHVFTIIHNAAIYSGCSGVENNPDIFHMQRHGLFS